VNDAPQSGQDSRDDEARRVASDLRSAASLSRLGDLLEASAEAGDDVVDGFVRLRKVERWRWFLTSIVLLGILGVVEWNHHVDHRQVAHLIQRQLIAGGENHQVLVDLEGALSPATQTKNDAKTAQAVTALAKVTIYAVECSRTFTTNAAFEACVADKVNGRR
jgi:hypothetical protein